MQKLPFFIIPFLILPVLARSQAEAIMNDIKGCNNGWALADVHNDVVKKLRNERDTMNFFHDVELAVFLNIDKTKNLSPNTLYVFNHGYNKSVAIDILSVEYEIRKKGGKKDTITPGIQAWFRPTGGDSLLRCAYTKAEILMPVHVKNARLTALYVRIQYYDKTIYRWFAREKSILQIIPHRIG